jgi:hypothetical protein
MGLPRSLISSYVMNCVGMQTSWRLTDSDPEHKLFRNRCSRMLRYRSCHSAVGLFNSEVLLLCSIRPSSMLLRGDGILATVRLLFSQDALIVDHLFSVSLTRGEGLVVSNFSVGLLTVRQRNMHIDVRHFRRPAFIDVIVSCSVSDDSRGLTDNRNMA